MPDNYMVRKRGSGGMHDQSIPSKRAALLTQRRRAMQPNLGVSIGWIATRSLPNAGAGGSLIKER
jgi:hypothetical protein